MRRYPFLQAVLVLLAAAALLAACGDKPDLPATDQSQAGQAQQAEREYDLDETGRAAAGLLGGDGAAAYAVLKAFDSGYSPYQIAHAVDAGLIAESGVIESLTPAWPSGNTLSSRNDHIRFVIASVTLGVSAPTIFAEANDGLSDRSDFEQMFQEINDQGQSGRWLVWLLGATGTGYSVEQITDYLAENKPFTDLSPPTTGGVPIVVGGDGNVVTPELPTDWPYKGRNILADLQEDEDLDFDDNVTVLVIGMVNAGYSPEQVWEALKGNSIGLCSTQGDSNNADAAFSPCYVENGAIVAPAETTKWSPARIVVEDVIPSWPLKNTAGQGSPDKSSQLQSGKAVSLKLTPYFRDDASALRIASHDIVMEIKPAGGDNPFYNITGTWEIKIVRTKTETEWYYDSPRTYEKGETYVLTGEFYSDDPTSLGHFGLSTEYTWTHHAPDGEVKAGGGDVAKYRPGASRPFEGSLDADLEGDGQFNTGPWGMGWDTSPLVEE
ncbi:MAG TPA: hypothetical protein VFH61_16815 [Thermoleophilia bacterium]|nr:hypothetical protein [Thermoleophilia bacterium]